MKIVKYLILALVLVGAARLDAETPDAEIARNLAKSISIQFMPGNSRSDLGAIVLTSDNSPFTVASPLTVEVVPLDARGASLNPKPSGGVAIDWASEAPVDNDVRGHRVIIEIPIGTYRGGGAAGMLATVLRRFDETEIRTVRLSFPLKIRNVTVEVSILVAGAEARRFFGTFFSQ